MVVAGQFAMDIDEDQEEGGLVFQHWSLAEVSVGSTRADGRIDIVHREYKLTAEAAAREFGEDKLPDGIRRKLRDKPDDEIKCLHAIYPRTPYAVRSDEHMSELQSLMRNSYDAFCLQKQTTEE